MNNASSLKASREIPHLDKNFPADDNQRIFGWHAHMGHRCVRCGNPLGPFQVGRGCENELWGCPHCGIGVFYGEKGQPDINAAADMFMSMVGHA